MSDFKPFLANIFPLPLLQERAKIINSLARYVTHNWRDPYRGKPDPRAETFRQAVQGLMARHFIEYHDMTPAVRKKMRDPGDTTELVMEAYDEAIRFDESEFIAVPHFSDEKLVKAFTERFGKLPLGAQVVNCGEEEKPSVQGAFSMATKNFAQASTRLLTFSVIHKLLQFSEYTNGPELAESAALRDSLYADLSASMKDMLLFGGLLGGQAHAQAVKLVARMTCHKEQESFIQFSVMHFITADRRHPGIHATKTVDALRADIRAKYDAL